MMDRTSKEYTAFLEQVLEQVDGTIVTDAEGKVVYLNKKYADMLGVDVEKSIGKYAREIIPQTRMDIVAKTGQEEIGSVHMVKGTIPVVCNRLPVMKDGKSIGAVAFTTFRKMDEVASLFAEINRLNLEIKEYKSELVKLRGAKYSLGQVVGSSPQLQKVKELIKKVAPSKLAVLISGETGTGKELFAQAIHQLSPRKHKTFVRINCAAIPKELLESELFGYEEGAFSGAKKGGKPGKFELANEGTLLLDEINELPIFLQSKLLRVIQEHEIERVGGIKPIEIDVRLICTTNRDMQDLVRKGEFREDLFYRINVVDVSIPPLRQRKEEIRDLTSHFIKKINANHGLGITGIKEDVLRLFEKYQWPGNVRELEHVMERAAVMAISGELDEAHFDYLIPRLLGNTETNSAEQNGSASLGRVKDVAEKQAILNALSKANGNKTAAANELNIHRTLLYAKMKKHGIV
ncbi:MAG: sigma 54-interacting transcriptional regulator [Sporomusaceae bacterium]|nr:sigma 54-interacting transcriptional regulator [Sporomusaceae bacterium]